MAVEQIRSYRARATKLVEQFRLMREAEGKI
jgi:hypothetical protein